jgi:sugar porter (SP) family MFS transporter
MNSTLLRATVVAALGGLLFGFDTAVIAGTTSALTRTFGLTPATLGATISIALWGTVLGAMTAGYPGDRYGRRASLRLLAVLYLVSAIGCALAWSWGTLMAARFIGGLAIGGSSVLGPMYIAEVSPARLRGRLVGTFQFNIVFGILLAYFSNYVIGSLGLGEAEWRWKLGVAAVPSLLFLVMLYTIPRSPRWLVKTGQIDEARHVLGIVGEPDPDRALKDIVASIDVEHGLGSEPLFQRKYRLPIFLAVSIGVFNQLSGINAILYYLNDIFAKAGFDRVSSDLQAVAVGFTNLAATVVAMAVIDRLGRKKMLLVGAVGTAVALLGVAYVFASGTHGQWLVWLLVVFIAFFAFSQGAVIWVYLSEVFPNRVRAKGQSLGSATHWVMNAIVSLVFPIVAASSGAAPFFVFAAMTAVQFLVVWSVYPETTGLTLEEMQRELGIH